MHLNSLVDLLINSCGNLKLEFDKLNKNFKIVLDSLTENRVYLKNLEEILDLIKDKNIVELDKILGLEEWRLKLK